MGNAESVKPYNDEEAKGKQVGEMFDAIAPSYDFMNTMMTGGLHVSWRNKALNMAAAMFEEARVKRQEARGKSQESRDKRQGGRGKGEEARGKSQGGRVKRQETRGKGEEAREKRQESRDKRQGGRVKSQEGRGAVPESVLDVACGTGDVSFRIHELFPNTYITGLDLSAGMLKIAKEKLAGMDPATQEHISFIEGDSLDMPFADETFDMVTVAYGVRNFERLEDGYREMRRVLKPGGVLCVIELSEPKNPLIKKGYRLYSRNVIPLIGRMVSKDTRAYSYLPESIAACPQRGEMTAMMERAGFREASYKSLTLGVITIYLAKA